MVLAASNGEEAPAGGESTPDDQPWTVLGGYELLEEIGRGGMGVVYRARQRRLGRIVAVKVLRGGAFAGAQDRRRFHAEAMHAAALQHPGIVSVHDAGEEQGVQWLAMEYVPGRGLDDAVRHQLMAAGEAAECLAAIADAVAHAHAHGVLHRDLKPSNIILDSGGAPHVTDFGIARRMEAEDNAARLTRSGQILGSPGYTAPEQMTDGPVDARTDVYGLGSILYHLLTGRPPFQGVSLESVLLQVRGSDPLPPRTLTPGIPRDLETICLKALAREPSRRYATAEAFAADARRFLAGLPVAARPASAVEKTGLWCRRRPGLAAALAVAGLAIAAGTSASVFMAVRARRAADQAVSARNAAVESGEVSRRTAYAATMLRAQSEIERGSSRAADLLESLRPQPGQTDLRGWEWYYLRGEMDQSTLLRREDPSQEPRAAVWSPDGLRYAVTSVSADGRRRVAVCRAADGQEVRVMDVSSREVPYLTWQAGGRLLATGDSDTVVKVWDTETGAMLYELSHPDIPPGRSAYRPPPVAFSPDGQWLAVCTWDDSLRIHRSRDGLTVRVLPGHYECMAWHPDSRRLAAAVGDAGTIEIHPVPGGEPVISLPQPEGVCSLAWRPDGRILAAGSYTSRVRFINPDAPADPVTVTTFQGAAGHLAWNGDGSRLLSGGWNGLLASVDPARGIVDRWLWGHQSAWITSLTVHADTALSWGKDGTLRRWNLGATGGALGTPAPVDSLLWSEGRLFVNSLQASAGDPCAAALQETPGAPLRSIPLPFAHSAAWSPGGSRLAVVHSAAGPAGALMRALFPHRTLITLHPGGDPGKTERAILAPLRVRDISWSPRGDRLLATGPGQDRSLIFSAEDGRLLCRIPAVPHHYYHLRSMPLAWSPDGRYIFLWGGDVLYDTGTGAPAPGYAALREVVDFPVESVAFSPDGGRLALGGADGGQVCIARVSGGEVLARAAVHNSWVFSLAWHPSGTRLATTSLDGTVKVLDAATLDELLVFTGGAVHGCAAAWSGDGRMLASTVADQRVVVRRAAP